MNAPAAVLNATGKNHEYDRTFDSSFSKTSSKLVLCFSQIIFLKVAVRRAIFGASLRQSAVTSLRRIR